MFNWPMVTYVWVALLIVAHVLLTAWVLVGGWFDLLFLLRMLREERVDSTDDGRVDTKQPTAASGRKP